MNDYLTPEIGKVIPFLAQTCDELVRQELIRALTAKSQEWCEGDPELADVILEGKKTLEGCVKYVLEQAATYLAKVVSAMPDEEVKMLPTKNINGTQLPMVGGAVGAETVFEWARDYYYKAKGADPVADKKKDDTDKASKSTGNNKAKNKSKGTSGSQKTAPGTEAKARVDSAPAKVDNEPPEQMTLGGTKKIAA